ncbi:MAG TPA: nitroreductase family protein, partial [Tissierellaceae bacterium]|nr:nitroreductase family protein [Tissierellaceae bacterium]
PISNAPLAMVILADAEITDTWIEDAAIMATIVQVTAHSLGLGSCWVQVRERFTTDGQSVDSFVKDLLNIPDKYQVSAIISIGYPAEDKDAYTKDKLDYNKVHHNKF